MIRHIPLVIGLALLTAAAAGVLYAARHPARQFAGTPDVAAVEAALEHDGFVQKELLAHPEILIQAAAALKAKNDGGGRTAVTLLGQAADGGTVIPARQEPHVDVVEFSDFNCPFCRAAAPSVLRLAAEQADVRLVFRELPIIHPPASIDAAMIAVALGRQGKYLAFYKKALGSKGTVDRAAALLIAAAVGADMTKLKTDLADPAIAKSVENDLKLGQALHITGTPTFIIGGHEAAGALPYNALLQKIDEARQAAHGRAAANGTK